MSNVRTLDKPASPLMTIAEVARMAQVDRSTVTRMLNEQGHYLGVKPIYTSRTVRKFSRVAIRAVLYGDATIIDPDYLLERRHA